MPEKIWQHHLRPEQQPRYGIQAFFNTVDCIIIDRCCMEVIFSMQFLPQQWPYGDVPIYAHSNTLKILPNNVKEKWNSTAAISPS